MANHRYTIVFASDCGDNNDMTYSTNTRIGIIGAGALGGLFGGYLHQSGEDVYLVDKNPELVRTLNEDGLRIERSGQEDITVQPTATTDPAEVDPVDLLFVFVKAIHTDQAIQDAAPMRDDETIAVTVQNGLKNMEIIGEHFPSERILGGTTTMGSSIKKLGHILHTGSGETKIGGEDNAAAARTVDVLKNAGLDATVVGDPRPHIWDKQLISVAIKPTAALTELLDGPLADTDETAWVMEQLVFEAMTVAEARGVELISDDPIETVREVCAVNYDTMSSMLEDVLNERRTEIDHINGAIVDYGEQEGIETPYNRMVTNLVKGKEYSYTDRP